MSEDLQNFIREHFKLGTDAAQVRSELLNAGWDAESVDSAIAYVQAEMHASSHTPDDTHSTETHDDMLEEYVRTHFELGTSPEVVKQELAHAGWDVDIIDGVIAQVQGESQVAANAVPVEAAHAVSTESLSVQKQAEPTQAAVGEITSITEASPVQTSSSTKLPGVFALIGESFSIFKQVWWKLIGGYILGSFVAGLIAVFVTAIIAAVLYFFFFKEYGPLGFVALGGVALPILGVVINITINAFALMFTGYILAGRNERLGIFSAMGKTFARIHVAVWIILLMWAAITGGYLLLIVPGIIMTVWFLFALFIPAVEGDRGLAALMKSREYVRGYWWPVTGRLLALGALIAVGATGIVVALIAAGDSTVIALISFAAYFLLTIMSVPFTYVYSYNLYEHLRGIKGEITITPTSKEKGMYGAVAVLGVLAAAALVYSSFMQ